MDNKTLKFPKGFFWGAATSAYQVEGGLINDWSEWEKSSERLKELKEKGLNPIDFQSGLAANSWNKFEDDILCLKKINAKAYRFSIDWSRVEPEEGRFDETVLNHYSSMVARLKEENIEPFVTLWHWPIPLWLRDKGGWSSSIIIEYFKKYTERVVMVMPTVKFWCTLNEPNVYAGKSYLTGEWPPKKKNVITYLWTFQNLIKAHRAAYKVIKENKPEAIIGIALHYMYFEADWNPVNKLIKAVMDWWSNYYFLNSIKNYQDYVGLNYYLHIKFGKLSFTRSAEEKKSDLGWGLSPKGFYHAIMDVKKYNKPIYILEQGLADEKDINRAWYIKESVKAIHQAISDGADVRSYLHWSLLDNFEWADGFAPKFGLFSVDRKTFIRTPRSSVQVFSEIAKNNELDPRLHGDDN